MHYGMNFKKKKKKTNFSVVIEISCVFWVGEYSKGVWRILGVVVRREDIFVKTHSNVHLLILYKIYIIYKKDKNCYIF